MWALQASLGHLPLLHFDEIWYMGAKHDHLYVGTWFGGGCLVKFFPRNGGQNELKLSGRS